MSLTRAELVREAAPPRRRTLPAPILLATLTFSTGFLDALTYLGLHQIFGANMTGNLILIGIGVGGDRQHLINPLVAILAFCAGCALGGACGRLLKGRGRDGDVPRALLTIAGILLGASAILTLVEVPAHGALTITGLVGVAMGFQSLAARLLAVPEINTVVVTSTLSQLFANIGAGVAWRRARVSGLQVAAITSMLLGAVVGAVVVPVTGLTALLAPTVAVLLVAALLGSRDL